MKAQILWEMGAGLQLLIGHAHILGTLFGKLLHPRDPRTELEMKSGSLNMDGKINQWKAWIFFNLAFGILLVMLGVVSFYVGRMEAATGTDLFRILMASGMLAIAFSAHFCGIGKVRTAFALVGLFQMLGALLLD